MKIRNKKILCLLIALALFFSVREFLARSITTLGEPMGFFEPFEVFFRDLGR